ncbi:GtrA family protein [Parapedobacter lycopersici]|uniref:GtrA family protein n=1 Tax=Parapedobacter lycopersici TaxID=1864939 RepID=UPI00214DA80B|nr:GtrA family protein [Parapedobacter lycopersici]
MELSSDLINKFLKFGLVGLSGVVVDFGVTWGCKEKLHLHKYVANSLGFMVATVSNYLLNKFWTFHAVGRDAMFIEFSKFFGIALVGLLINNLILYVVHEKLGLNFYLAKVFAIGMVAIWNFMGNYIYTFSS